DQETRERWALLVPHLHETGVAAKRKRSPAFAVRHIEANHRSAILLLESLGDASGLDNDDADRARLHFVGALDDGIDDRVGLLKCNVHLTSVPTSCISATIACLAARRKARRRNAGASSPC